MIDPKLQPLAALIGAAWASELAHTLRAADRDVIGAWPGTMSEARTRLISSLRTKLDLKVLDELAKIVNVAARRSWHEASRAEPSSIT